MRGRQKNGNSKIVVIYPAGTYLFKVNNGNARTMYEICSKATIKTPERWQWRRFGVFIVNLEQISHIVLLFFLLTLNKLMPAGWWLRLTEVSSTNFPKFLLRIALQDTIFILHSFYFVILYKLWGRNESLKYLKSSKITTAIREHKVNEFWYGIKLTIRSSSPKVFLEVLKIWSKVTGGQLCRSAISIKLQNSFIEITLRHECSPVSLLHIFRLPFPKNISGGMLLKV